MHINGKVVVVTGATSGLGQAFAIQAAQQGAQIILVGRDKARAEETRAACGKAEVVLGDISTKAGVKAIAEAILAKASRLDVLINNAGGMFKTQSKTRDGIETTFALNTLGAFILERHVHSALAAAKGRIVNLTTGFLDNFPIVVDELTEPKKYGGFQQYGRAKQASLMLTVEQANRYAPEGITAVGLHPGIILGTRFEGPPKPVQMIMGPIMRAFGVACTLEESTRRFMVAAFGDVPSGSYVVKGAAAPLPKQVRDAAVRTQVYDLLNKLAS